MEDNKLKIYGAGLLSSASEMEYVIKGLKCGNVRVDEFSVDRAIATPCMVTTFQKRYFVTQDIMYTQTEIRWVREKSLDCQVTLFSIFSRKLAESLSQVCNKRYNPYTQCIEEISSTGKIIDIANELRGDLYLVQQAAKKMVSCNSQISASDTVEFDETDINVTNSLDTTHFPLLTDFSSFHYGTCNLNITYFTLLTRKCVVWRFHCNLYATA